MRSIVAPISDHVRVAGMIPIDDRGWSPFRAAVEAKDFGQVKATLAADVHFRSPAVYKPYEGQETVGAVLQFVGTILLPGFSYRWQMHDGDREVLCFTTTVGGREVEGVDLLRYDEDGLVAELVVMMRPASGLAAVREAVAAAAAGTS
jgi:hypothetical protein